MAGLTLDSGALIGFERNDRRVLVHLREAHARGVDITVPTVVVAETWRGGAQSARISRLLSACVVEPLTEPLARAAGQALATVAKATTIDAIVMASAAVRGDHVLTADAQDLGRLQRVFPEVHVIRV